MLVKDKLIHNIRSLTDEEYEYFKGFPESYNESIRNWTLAFSDYYKDVIPFSTNVNLAEMVFSVLMKGFEGKDLDLAVIYELTIVELSSGMVGWTSKKSSTKLILKDIYQIGLDGGSSKEVAEKMSERIHNWMLKGTAINLTPPNTLIFWS